VWPWGSRGVGGGIVGDGHLADDAGAPGVVDVAGGAGGANVGRAQALALAEGDLEGGVAQGEALGPVFVEAGERAVRRILLDEDEPSERIAAVSAGLVAGEEGEAEEGGAHGGSGVAAY